MNPSSLEGGALPVIARLVRRICLLAEQGDELAAARLEQEQLVPAVRDYRAQYGPGALTEERMAGIFVEERRRAADAIVLAELLIPQLVGRAFAPVRPAPAALDPRRQRAEPHTSIPDLLDAMLAGDAARRRRA